jgi:molybdopterin/thiamine biosynthesis adenylyltransferase/rhodanese-related sulfurtransferase
MAMPTSEPRLRPDQFDRYRRHLSLPEVGAEGQARLLASSVLLIGAGGLGCPLALYLAAAGVGRIGLVDDDVVDVSNLQRQILYRTSDVGRLKVEAAAERIEALNPDVRVDQFALRLDSSNALEIFDEYDVIVDGTDNFPTRYLSNDACVLLGKPNVYGSIYRFEGQASVFDARQGPCYRCLYPEPPPPGAVPSCEEGGVLGVLPGMVAIIQATETVKLLTGVGRSLAGRLIAYDALAMEWNEFRLKKDPECPVCGPDPTVTELIDYQGFCGFNPSETEAPRVVQVSAADLHARLEGPGEMLLLDVRGPEEVAKASIEGARAVPLADLEARLGEIEAWRDRPVVVHCHHGGRSAQACAELTRLGFSQVENLDGGIEAWSLTVDDSVPRY